MNVAILAGGKATRMGCIDKGLVRVCGERIIERLLRTFKDCRTVIVCRDERQAESYACFADVITDIYPGCGPLAGIHAALKHFGERTLAVAIDMPFIVRRVAEEIFNTAEKKDADAAIPRWNDGKFEPLLACYSPSINKEIEKSLKAGEKKIMAPVLRSKVIFIPIEELKQFDVHCVSFFNLNSPEDIRRAEELCSLTDSEGQ